MTPRPRIICTTLLFTPFLTLMAEAAEPLSCPKGTRQEGAPPPAGTAAWCAGPDLFGQVRKNGPFKRWRADGRLLREGQYVDGKKHGHWAEYDEAGQVVAEAEYRFGAVIRSSGSSPAPERAAPEVQVAARPRAGAQTEAPATTTALAPATSKTAAPSSSPARTEGAEAPAAEEWTPTRRDDDLEVSALGPRGKADVGARLAFDNTLSSVQSALIYAPRLDLAIHLSAFLFEAQWGFVVLSPPGADAVTVPLNPMFLLGGELKYDALTMSLGVGATIPVLSISSDLAGLLRLTAAAAAPTVRGMRDFWLSLPEVPAVLLPVRGRYQHEALELGFRVVPYFAIPIHGGSSDLALELGGGATYGVDFLRFGGDLHLISVGVTSGNLFFSIEPKVGVVFGPAQVMASVSLTPLKPELGPDTGLLWSTNLGVELKL